MVQAQTQKIRIILEFSLCVTTTVYEIYTHISDMHRAGAVLAIL
jgi:hypothetical protein